MPSSAQLTGMRGVYLVAAELSKLGLIAAPTSRSARGADILVTNESCSKTWSVQVKTNTKTFSFWLLSKAAQEMVAEGHVYVLVNLRSTKKQGEQAEYFYVPSKVVAERVVHKKSRSGKSDWFEIHRDKVLEYQDPWQLFQK